MSNARPDGPRTHAYTQIPGHGLAREGYPHDADGKVLAQYGTVRTSGPGHAKCSCGELSPELPSTAARKKWHRETHKAQALAEDTPQ